MTTAVRESRHKLKGSFGRGIMEGSFGTGTPSRERYYMRIDDKECIDGKCGRTQ